MRTRRLLLAATALATVLGACERPVKPTTPKRGVPDAGVSSDGSTDGPVLMDEDEPDDVYANTKGLALRQRREIFDEDRAPSLVSARHRDRWSSMPKMRKRRLVRYANDKRLMYEPDAGVGPSDALDAGAETTPPAEPPQ